MLQKLEAILQEPGQATKKKALVAPMFLQCATSWLTIFVDPDQKRTLADIVFLCYLELFLRERPLTPPLSTSASAARMRVRELCHQLFMPQLHSHPWYRGKGLRQDTYTVEQIEQALYHVAAYLAWFPRLRFGQPMPWSFELLTPEEQNTYTIEEQAQDKQREALEAQETCKDDTDPLSLWYPERLTAWDRDLKESKDPGLVLPEALKTSLRETWRLLIPLQGLWLVVNKRRELREAHRWQDVPYWTSGHRNLLPSLWSWVNMHPGHNRTTEARNLYFTRLLTPGRRDQVLRFVGGNYSRLSPANILRMCAPLKDFSAADHYSTTHIQVLFGLRLPQPEPSSRVTGKRKRAVAAEREREPDQDTLGFDEDPELMKQLWRRRVSRLTPCDQWNDLHISWLVTQFDNHLEGEAGVCFRDQFLLMDCELLQEPFKWSEYGGQSHSRYLRAPIVVELADTREWGVSVIHKQYTKHANGTRTYREKRRGAPVLHRCRNLMDALQCWINALAEPPYTFHVRGKDGKLLDLRQALEPLVAHHDVGTALHTLAGLTSFPV